MLVSSLLPFFFAYDTEGELMLRHSSLAVQCNLHGDFDHKKQARVCHAGCFKTALAKKRKLCRLGYSEGGKLVLEHSFVDAEGNVVSHLSLSLSLSSWFLPFFFAFKNNGLA